MHGNDDVRSARRADALQSEQAVLRQSLQNGGDPAFGLGWFDVADLAAGVPRSRAMDIEANLLERLQLPDGSWQPGPPRVPIQSSAFKATANAARVLQASASADNRDAFAGSVNRARAWLLRHAPVTTDDKVYRLGTAARSTRELRSTAVPVRTRTDRSPAVRVAADPPSRDTGSRSRCRFRRRRADVRRNRCATNRPRRRCRARRACVMTR